MGIRKCLCPHEESNLDYKIRNLAFYPLNYRGVVAMITKAIARRLNNKTACEHAVSFAGEIHYKFLQSRKERGGNPERYYEGKHVMCSDIFCVLN